MPLPILSLFIFACVLFAFAPPTILIFGPIFLFIWIVHRSNRRSRRAAQQARDAERLFQSRMAAAARLTRDS